MTVFVDGSSSINHYTMEVSVDWITVDRVRNYITMSIAENTSPSDRFGMVKLTHNLDADRHVTVIFMQSAPTYTVSVSRDGEESPEVVFSTLYGQNDQDSETEEIDVECVGGTEDYMVRGVLEYSRASENLPYRVTPYDGGLKVAKTSPSKLSITNYGKIPSADDMYYDVVLAHRNSPRSTARVRVSYRQDASDGGFSLDD